MSADYWRQKLAPRVMNCVIVGGYQAADVADMSMHLALVDEDGPPDYLAGMCHVFALALHREYGFKMLALLDKAERYGNGVYPTEDHHDGRHHYGDGLLHHVQGHDPEAARQPDARADRAEGEHALAGLEAATGLLGSPDRLIHVGDRENDIFEFFCTARTFGTHFLVRTCVDRLALDGKRTVIPTVKSSDLCSVSMLTSMHGAKPLPAGQSIVGLV